MDAVNKTLYIPLYGKALVSKKGIILNDPKAEMIWEREGFTLKAKSKSRWLAYYMGMRSAVFDRWTVEKIEEYPETVVLHIGCGMDSRCERVGNAVEGKGDTGYTGNDAEKCAKNPSTVSWYDVDFPSVISERRKYYKETGTYHMVGADVRETAWIAELPDCSRAVIIMEGISMYLSLLELVKLLTALKDKFGGICLLIDCYTELGAKASRYKNPVKDVGVQMVFGLDYPEYLAEQTGLTYVREHEMTPESLICQLEGSEQKFFRTMFGGKLAKKMYRMYEYAV